MSKLRVENFSVSVDGFAAGPDQSLENPLGVGGTQLHKWMVATKTFKHMIGESGGTTDTDNDYTARGFRGIGSRILGRNMFGPIRGPWQNEDWKGWWGDNPPYHTDVFVLTHYARKSIKMKGGTTFYFVTDGIEQALKRAIDAANGLDVQVGGGVATIRQYLRAGLIDEMHVAVSPVLLGRGENLFHGIDMLSLGYTCIEHQTTEHAMHIVLRKT